jgi:Zn-finger protein
MKRLLEKLRFLNVSFYNVHYFSTSDCSISYYLFASCSNLMLGSSKLQLRGNVKILKALVLSHVKRLENEMVRMLLVAVSLVCQLRESVSIV